MINAYTSDSVKQAAMRANWGARSFANVYGSVGLQERNVYREQLLGGTISAAQAIMSGNDPIRAFAGNYNNQRLTNNITNLLNGKFNWSGSAFGKYGAMRETGGMLLAGALTGRMGGYAQEGSAIGGMLAQSGALKGLIGGLGPWGVPAAMLGGGLLGRLFGKSRKDPAVEAHRKKLEELLSRIDKSLRPVGDYFRVIRGEAAWGAASGYYSGRVNHPLGAMAGMGGL